MVHQHCCLITRNPIRGGGGTILCSPMLPIQLVHFHHGIHSMAKSWMLSCRMTCNMILNCSAHMCCPLACACWHYPFPLERSWACAPCHTEAFFWACLEAQWVRLRIGQFAGFSSDTLTQHEKSWTTQVSQSYGYVIYFSYILNLVTYSDTLRYSQILSDIVIFHLADDLIWLRYIPISIPRDVHWSLQFWRRNTLDGTGQNWRTGWYYFRLVSTQTITQYSQRELQLQQWHDGNEPIQELRTSKRTASSALPNSQVGRAFEQPSGNREVRYSLETCGAGGCCFMHGWSPKICMAAPADLAVGQIWHGQFMTIWDLQTPIFCRDITLNHE